MLGSKIQKLRLEKKLTLTELANRTGISKSYLSYIERNIQKNPSIEVLAKIASALEVVPQTLFTTDKLSPDPKDTRKLHVADWSNLINTALESGLINEDDLEEIRLAIKVDKSEQ
jgi:XRE family transcriptional regulator of biofilm formation